MSRSGFVTKEKADSQEQSLGILFRFIFSLRLLRFLVWPYLALMSGATVLPQVFLWLTGEYSKCGDVSSCYTELPLLGQVHLTLGFFLTVVLAAIVLKICSWALFEIGGQWAARDLHAHMIRSVSDARTTFFDENPSGRLINRLVRDYDHLRTMGVIRIGDTLNALVEILCGAGLIFFVSPFAAFLVLPAIVVVFYIQYHVAAMLHKCGTVRSTRFGEVLHRETDLIEGARSFLLYGKERSLFRRIKGAIERYIQLHLVHARVEAWGLFWTNTVNAVYCFVSLVFVVYAVHHGWISTVFAAVIITAVLRLAGSFMWFAWVLAYLMDTVAIARRVFEFVDLPNEVTQEFSNGRGKSEEESPVQLAGDIEFDGYCMSYRADTPVILNGLSVRLEAGSKIGVIGRTGAGKTSLVQSLYRMVHVRGGDIRIGGRSIFDYDINFVRSHFSVVPQDPYLFAGTIRSNLDRTGEFSDAELEAAMQLVGLDFALDAAVNEGGKNFSLGERQLLCLARVITSRRPFIIMDEPTSGVDTITDARIQEVLAGSLGDRTVITIAHRLETLQRYDWIIEMREGRLFRQGRPSELTGKITGEDLG